jgi:hypothetical protein
MHVKCPVAWHFLAVEANMKTVLMQRNIPVPIHNKWLIISSIIYWLTFSSLTRELGHPDKHKNFQQMQYNM